MNTNPHRQKKNSYPNNIYTQNIPIPPNKSQRINNNKTTNNFYQNYETQIQKMSDNNNFSEKQNIPKNNLFQQSRNNYSNINQQ